MHIDHIHGALPPSQLFLVSSTLSPSQLHVFLVSLLITSCIQLVQPYAHECEAILRDKSNPSLTKSPKESESPLPYSHLLAIMPQLGVGP